MDKVAFGKRFRYLRKGQIKKSMAELGEILKISTSFISDVENGKSLPGAEILYSLYRNFSINSQWLLTGEGPVFVEVPTGEGKTAAALREVALRTAELHDRGKASPAFGFESEGTSDSEAADQQELEKLEQENAELKARLEQTEKMLVLLAKRPVPESQEQSPGRVNRGTLEDKVESLEHNLETLQRFVQRIVFREGGAALLEEPPEEKPEGSNVHSVVYIKGTKEKTDKPQEEPENERA